MPRICLATARIFDERCRKDSGASCRSTGWLKVIDARSNAAQKRRSHHPCVLNFGSRPLASAGEPQQYIWFTDLMRLGFFLMIAAFIIMGAEVAYALYQLAGLVL